MEPCRSLPAISSGVLKRPKGVTEHMSLYFWSSPSHSCTLCRLNAL